MCPGLSAVRMVVYGLGVGEEEKLPPPWLWCWLFLAFVSHP